MNSSIRHRELACVRVFPEGQRVKLAPLLQNLDQRGNVGFVQPPSPWLEGDFIRENTLNRHLARYWAG